MAGDEDQPFRPPVFYVDDDGTPITEEQYRAKLARQEMARQSFGADWRRLLFEELTDDQLETVRLLFRMLGAGDGHALISMVGWYEGFVDAAVHARRLASGGVEVESRERHAYRADHEFPVCAWNDDDRGICAKPEGDEAHRGERA